MSFRLRIQHYLVHYLSFTNKEAAQAIHSGKLRVGGTLVTENSLYNQQDEIVLDGVILKARQAFRYVLFYKPAGIETTYNDEVPCNLNTVLPAHLRFMYAGRLDKASEGLLLLTDDGKFIHDITDPSSQKEKEYIVKVDKPLTEQFLREMASGIEIQGYKTKPCLVTQMADDSMFTIILTEGRNRQIRRMCYRLGYTVLLLKRIRIGQFTLGDLGVGEWKEVSIAG